MIRSLLRIGAVLLMATGPATAQDAREPIPVRTFALQRLEVKDAAKLLAPYLQSPAAGAFETGNAVRAITVRGTARELKTVDSLLTIFDRAPRGVLLRFQIIEATEDTKKDPRITEVDASLHELFRYTGYRLIAEGIAKTEEAQGFDVSLGAEGASYSVRGAVISADLPNGSIRLSVSMNQPMVMGSQSLFATQLTVPVGQMVVLGSASPRFYERKAGDTTGTAVLLQAPRQGRPVILTVRPDVIGHR
ncbi:MAG: hypothetical protein ACYC7F_10895 [Gemmatimonadaceae bacterium]